MMGKTHLTEGIIVINQPFGIGDIIFCMAIAEDYISRGYKVIWPVFDHWIEGLRRAYPKVEWTSFTTSKLDSNIRKESIVEWDGKPAQFIPLRWNVENLKVPYEKCMHTKYHAHEHLFEKWRDSAKYKRDLGKENSLMKVLGIEKGDRYILVNRYYTSNSAVVRNISPTVNKGVKIVEMSSINGYSMFDWTSVILGAKEIHTVSTSLFYLLEILPITAPITLYARSNDKHFRHISFLFTKDYDLVK